MRTRRREMLLGVTAAVAATGSFPAPAIGQDNRELRMVTDWPEGLAGLDLGSQRLAQSVTAISDGRLKLTGCLLAPG